MNEPDHQSQMAGALGDAVVRLCSTDLDGLDVDAILTEAALALGAQGLVMPVNSGPLATTIAARVALEPSGVVAGSLREAGSDVEGSFLATLAEAHTPAFVVGFWVTDTDHGWDPMLVHGLRALAAAYAMGWERHRLAEEIANRESVTQAVLEAAIDSIITIDSKGDVVEFNPAAERMFGYSREEAVGRSMASLIVPPDYRGRHKRGITHYLETGEGPVLRQRIELPAMRADKSVFPAEVAIIPVSVGGEQHFTGYVRDITGVREHEQERERLLELELSARHEAEATRGRLHEQYQRLASLIASMSEAILVEDENRHIVVVNKAFCDLFEIPVAPDQLFGTDCSRAAEQARPLMADADGFLARINELLASRDVVIGEEVAFADGCVAERDFVPVFVGPEYRGHLWIYRDISDRKEADRQRELLLEASKREAAKLAELDQMRNEFLASVSHELRTPLTSIMSSASLLEDEALGGLEGDQRQFVEIIGRNADRMLGVIGQLLLMARLESSTVMLDPAVTRLHEVVETAVNAITSQAVAKGVILESRICEGPTVSVDAMRVGEVMDNLLSNAIKFTPEGGLVTVDARPDDEGGWRISVEDTGIGVPHDEADTVFGRFYRASNARELPEPGTGLGLYISKAIVELHGGQIDFDSEEGRGTTFVLTLPADAVPVAQ